MPFDLANCTMSWWGGKKPEKKKGAGADDFEKTDQTPGYDGEDVNVRVDVRASLAWHTHAQHPCSHARARPQTNWTRSIFPEALPPYLQKL